MVSIEKKEKAGKDPLIALYQSLTIDQCKELYLRQKDNLTLELRNIVKSIIASKYIYGEKYIPNYKYTNTQKNENE